MGAWGTGISSNDTFADVRGEFFELYDQGQPPSSITANLISAYRETINDPDDANDFWFALALAQWECNELEPELFDRVSNIITSGDDIERWRRLDADEKTIAKRRVALERFLEKLSSKRARARARKKKVIRQPPFGKGDCLTFRLANGNFGGAVVLEAERNTEYGYSLIATTRINQRKKPTKSDFEVAEVLVMNYGSWADVPCINWYLPVRHKNIEHLIENVDRLDVGIDYRTKGSAFGFMGDFDLWVIGVADQQFESEGVKPRSKTKQTIRQLVRSRPWKLW